MRSVCSVLIFILSDPSTLQGGYDTNIETSLIQKHFFNQHKNVRVACRMRQKKVIEDEYQFMEI